MADQPAVKHAGKTQTSHAEIISKFKAENVWASDTINESPQRKTCPINLRIVTRMELNRSDDIYRTLRNWLSDLSRRSFHTGKSFHSTNDSTNTSSAFLQILTRESYVNER